MYSRQKSVSTDKQMKREYVRMKERHRERERKTTDEQMKREYVRMKERERKTHKQTLEGNMAHSPMLHLTK